MKKPWKPKRPMWLRKYKTIKSHNFCYGPLLPPDPPSKLRVKLLFTAFETNRRRH